MERFVALVKDDFMTDCRFHRVIPNFVCQVLLLYIVVYCAGAACLNVMFVLITTGVSCVVLRCVVLCCVVLCCVVLCCVCM